MRTGPRLPYRSPTIPDSSDAVAGVMRGPVRPSAAARYLFFGERVRPKYRFAPGLIRPARRNPLGIRLAVFLTLLGIFVVVGGALSLMMIAALMVGR